MAVNEMAGEAGAKAEAEAEDEVEAEAEQTLAETIGLINLPQREAAAKDSRARFDWIRVHDGVDVEQGSFYGQRIQTYSTAFLHFLLRRGLF